MDAAIATEVTPVRSAVGAGGPTAAELLGCVADPVRWAVLAHLSAGESCVCDLKARVQVADNLISYHLRMLREAGLILARRRGRWIDYRLAPDAHERLAAALPVTGPAEPSPASNPPAGWVRP